MKVILNFAISADGKIGTSTGGASKFTSKKDLERLWEIRQSADAIMVGRKTLEADNMTMTIPPHLSPSKQPLRIIVSRQGVFNYDHPVFHSSGGDISLLSTEKSITCPHREVQVYHMELKAFLESLEETHGVKALLCEGGGELVRTLAELNVLTDIHLTFAGHTLIGGGEAPGILGTLQSYLPESQHFELTHFEENGEGELFLSYRRSTHCSLSHKV